MTSRRVHAVLHGLVQGVGLRPFLYRAATERGLTGRVCNDRDGVHLEVQGHAEDVASLLDAVRNGAPPGMRLTRLDVHEEAPRAEETFTIVASTTAGPREVFLPVDLATCPLCLAEVDDPGNGRYRYPFTNCTDCGPRHTILESVPYDRARTSMRRFPMCAACAAEYADPTNRRFHAEPLACHDCGPHISLLNNSQKSSSDDYTIISEIAILLSHGRIVALKGLGGFQLLADATNDTAVTHLRARKHRRARPLAVLFRDVDAIRRHAHVSDAEASLLASPQAPIVLLRPRADRAAAHLAPSVSPGVPRLGAMLPTTPLHHLLARAAGRPLVCTSGNPSGEPLCIDGADARARLGDVADVFVDHDRPVVRPVDDSLAWVDGRTVRLLRRARGYAPLPIMRPPGPVVLATGAHLKNTVALAVGDRIVASPHIGDLDGPRARALARRTAEDLLAFHDVRPERIACDLHPDYASTLLAEEFAERFAAPLVRVQHHHAHVAAAMTEHALTGDVLGLAWDGAGHGEDGVVWGGEALVCDGPTFRRVAHLAPFPLPGGERAIEEPRRSALGLLHATRHPERDARAAAWFARADVAVLLRALDSPRLAPPTTSIGRLFDAVAAFAGAATVKSFPTSSGRQDAPASAERIGVAATEAYQGNTPRGVDAPRRPRGGMQPRGGICGEALGAFEGQAAMAVQRLAEEWADPVDPYPLPLAHGTPLVADPSPLVHALLADLAAGVPPAHVAARFHESLAALAVAVARVAGCARVVLTGGCFQNAHLLARVRDRLDAASFRVYCHAEVPANDGGIAVGQAHVAALRERVHRS